MKKTKQNQPKNNNESLVSNIFYITLIVIIGLIIAVVYINYNEEVQKEFRTICEKKGMSYYNNASDINHYCYMDINNTRYILNLSQIDYNVVTNK
jgi:hypothetical protein